MIDFSLMTYKEEIVKALAGLIKIPSVKAEPLPNMPYGKGVFDALFYVLNLAERMDFESVNLFSKVGYVEYGEGDDLFVVLSHLDVVPAGEGWIHDPFGAEIEDGKMFGRGTLDDKGAAIISLFALYAIKENCKNLGKRVRLVFGCDEESGWDDMDFYVKHCPEQPVMAISPDADFPVINYEKGILHFSLNMQGEKTDNSPLTLKYLKGGDRVNVVPGKCKAFVCGEYSLLKEAAENFFEDLPLECEVKKAGTGAEFNVTGKSAHGSKPSEGINAVTHMIMFLNTLPLKDTASSRAVYKLAAEIGTDVTGKSLKIDCADDHGALTFNVGSAFIDDDEIKICVDVRYPSIETKENILKKVADALPDFEVKEEHFQLPHYVPEDSQLVRGLLKSYEEVTGEKGYCISMGGGTYARVFENAVAYGVLFPGQEGREHQAEEYVEIDSLIKAGDIIANAIMELCGE